MSSRRLLPLSFIVYDLGGLMRQRVERERRDVTAWRWQSSPAHHLALDFYDDVPRWRLRAFLRRIIKTGVQRGFYQLPVDLPGAATYRIVDDRLKFSARIVEQYDIVRDRRIRRIEVAWT